jgi:hypothetical protein
MAERPQLQRRVLDLSAPGSVIPRFLNSGHQAQTNSEIQQLAALEHWLLPP